MICSFGYKSRSDFSSMDIPQLLALYLCENMSCLSAKWGNNYGWLMLGYSWNIFRSFYWLNDSTRAALWGLIVTFQSLSRKTEDLLPPSLLPSSFIDSRLSSFSSVTILYLSPSVFQHVQVCAIIIASSSTFSFLSIAISSPASLSVSPSPIFLSFGFFSTDALLRSHLVLYFRCCFTPHLRFQTMVGYFKGLIISTLQIIIKEIPILPISLINR